MRKLLGMLLLLVSVPALATVHVRSSVTKKGVYRPAHHRTNPDHMRSNNWSTRGHVNPYTGKKGYRKPYK